MPRTVDTRVAAIAATCALGVGALAGCGSAKGEAKSSSAKTSASVSVSSATSTTAAGVSATARSATSTTAAGASANGAGSGKTGGSAPGASAKAGAASGATGASTRVGSDKNVKAARGTIAPMTTQRLKAAEQHGLQALRHAMEAYVACLRSHGVQAPANAVGSGPLPSLRGVNTNSPQFRAASVSCEAAAQSALRRG